MRLRHPLSTLIVTGSLVAACNTGSKSAPPAPAPSVTAGTPVPASTAEGVLRLGAPIEASAKKVALSDVAKEPNVYLDKTFATTVVRDEDGTFTVYDKTQGVQNVRDYLCNALGFKPDEIRVVAAFVGGAFGSGLRPQYQAFLAALAARELKRSVRVVLTR